MNWSPSTNGIEDLRAFDQIRYAQKALSNIAILDRIRKKGVVVDAVSAGEIERAIAAGFEPGTSSIVYTADVFDSEALDMVVKHNIPVNIGSPDMIDQLGERAPGREITLRINPGFGHGHSQKTNTGGPQSKHGIWHENVNDCLLRADRHGLTVTGLHMHIGSGTDLEHLGQVSVAMKAVAKQVGRTLKTISAGGGLPVPYRDGEERIELDGYFGVWNNTRKALQEEFGHDIELEIDQGRFLVAESGYLIAEIRSIKEMGENLFYLLDAGFNDLSRPILYGAYHPISICRRDGATTQSHEVVVGGPLCESGDIFTQRREALWPSETFQLPKLAIWWFWKLLGLTAMPWQALQQQVSPAQKSSLKTSNPSLFGVGKQPATYYHSSKYPGRARLGVGKLTS